MGGNLQIFATTAGNFENTRQRPILSQQGGCGFNHDIANVPTVPCRYVGIC